MVALDAALQSAVETEAEDGPVTSTSERPWWRQLIVGTLLLEAVFVIGYVVVADLTVLMADRPPVRAVVGLPLLLFFPGYAVLTVLFPGRPPRSRYGSFDPHARSVSGVERLALSFGISLALLPLIALALWTVDDQGFGIQALLGVITAVIVLGMAYGIYRRLQLPTRQRYRVPFGYGVTELRAGVFAGGVIGTLLRLGLALSVVLAMGTLGYAILVPNQSASYTGVSLLTRDTSGDLTAANYSNATTENGADLILSVQNNERTAVSYTAVVRAQRVGIDGDQVTVRSSSELQRLQTTVAAGETNYLPHSVSPSMNRENQSLRLQYLIYKGEPPAVTTQSNAYRTLFLWSNTSETNATTSENVSAHLTTSNTAMPSVIG